MRSAVLVLLFLTAACTPDMIHCQAPRSAIASAAACGRLPADMPTLPEHVSGVVSPDLKVAWVLRCTLGSPDNVVERANGPATALLTALNHPVHPAPLDHCCPPDSQVRPFYLALITPGGQVVVPYRSVEQCGQERPEVRAALTTLDFHAVPVVALPQ